MENTNQNHNLNSARGYFDQLLCDSGDCAIFKSTIACPTSKNQELFGMIPFNLVESQWLYPVEDNQHNESKPHFDTKVSAVTTDTLNSQYDQVRHSDAFEGCMSKADLKFNLNDSRLHEVCIAVVTWNVAGMNPQNIEYSGSLGRVLRETMTEPKPLVIAIGLQEIIELKFFNIAKRMFSYKALTTKWSNVLAGLMECINPDYILMEDESLVGLMSFLFVHLDIAGKVRLQERNKFKAGMNGLFGNKGSTITNLIIDDRHVIRFCNTHLASGVNSKDRGSTVKNLMDDYILNYKSDIFFLFGDLNMRVGVDKQSYFDIIKDRRVKNPDIDYNELLQHDELLREAHPLLSEHFAEAPIMFPPTYRLTKDGENARYSNKRVASWYDVINLGLTES